MELVQSFVNEFLVAIFMFAFGWLARIAYLRYQSTRPAHRVWQLKDSNTVLIVTPNPSGYVSDEFSDTVFPTDYMAIAELRRFFTQVYPHLNVLEYTAQEFPSQRIGENIALIGGEDINPITEIVLKRLRSADFPVGFDNDHIVDRGDEAKIYRPEILFDPSTRRNEIIKDYALVLGMPNPFEPSKRLYVLAGCYVYGNLAAVQAMVEPMIRNVNKRLRRGKNFIFMKWLRPEKKFIFIKRLRHEEKFIFIIESNVLRRFVGNIMIVRLYVYDSGQNRWVSKE